MQNHENLSKDLDVHDPGILKIINNFPFPIAYSYKKVMESNSLVPKLKSVFQAYESIVTYLSLVLLAFHYDSEDERISEHISGILDHPTFEDWFLFLKNIMETSSSQNQIVVKIKNWYQKVEKDKNIYFEEIIDYKKNEKEMGYLSGLCKIEQTISPVLPIMLEEEIQSYYRFCFTTLQNIIKELTFLQNYPIFFVENSGPEKGQVSVKKLISSDRNFMRLTLPTKQKLKSGHIYIFDSKAQIFYSLYPFVIYQECYYCIKEEFLDTWEIFFFYGKTNTRLCYQGSIHKIALREHLNRFNEMKARKSQREIQLENIKQLWDISFQATEDTLSSLIESKVLTNYYDRKDAEYQMNLFIKNEKPFFLLVGTGGVGKTVLLAEMAKRWSSHGEIVLFFKVFGHFDSLEETIYQSLGSRSTFEQALNILKQNNQKCIIIFDGIENGENNNHLIRDVEAFVDQYQEYFKVIFSCNAFQYKLLEPCFSSKKYMEFEGECPLIDISRNYFHLKEFRKTDLDYAYKTMSQNTSAPLGKFSSFSNNIKGILRNPSHMQIFINCLKNREVPKSLGINDILEGYVVNQVNFSKHRRDFVEQIIQTFLDLRVPRVDLDQIVDSDNMLLINEALTFTLFSTITELTREGILSKTSIINKNENNLIFYFPSRTLQEYLVYRSLALIGKHKDELLVDNIKNIEKGHFILYGLVYFAMLRLTNKQYYDRFVNILVQIPDSKYFVRQLVYDVVIFKLQTAGGNIGEGGPADSIVTNILANPTRPMLLSLVDIAIYLYSEKNFVAAAFLFQKLSNISQISEKFSPLSLAILAAYCLQKIGDHKQAVKIYKKCYKSLKKIEQHPNEVCYYYFLGRSHRELGDNERAEVFFKKCHEFKDRIQGTPIEADLYEDFGYMIEKNHDYPKALKYFQKQHSILESLELEHKSAMALKNISRIYQKIGNASESITTLEDAIDIFEDTGDTINLAYCRKELGIILSDMGRNKEASSYLVKALSVFENTDDKVAMAKTYFQLGKICENLGKDGTSREYFDKAIELLKSMNDYKNRAECYEKIGSMDMKKGNYESAKKHFDKALNIYRKIPDKTGISNIFNLIGVMNQEKGNYPAAIEAFNESLKIRKTLANEVALAEVFNNIAMSLALSNQLPLALENVEKATQLNSKHKNSKGLATGKSIEALIYKMQSNNTKALECYKLCANMFQEIGEKKLLQLFIIILDSYINSEVIFMKP